MSALEFIKECQEKVFSGNHITVDDARKLLDIPDENLKDLARCANEITLDFNGKKVDVDTGDFVIKTDQSVKSGGDASAPPPFDLFLASIGACSGIYVLSFCQTLPAE